MTSDRLPSRFGSNGCAAHGMERRCSNLVLGRHLQLAVHLVAGILTIHTNTCMRRWSGSENDCSRSHAWQGAVRPMQQLQHHWATDRISLWHVVGQLLRLIACHVLPHLLTAIREQSPHGERRTGEKMCLCVCDAVRQKRRPTTVPRRARGALTRGQTTAITDHHHASHTSDTRMDQGGTRWWCALAGVCECC